MGIRPERVNGHIGTEIRPRLLREAAAKNILTERRRVNEEGRKVVKFFCRRRISTGGNDGVMTVTGE